MEYKEFVKAVEHKNASNLFQDPSIMGKCFNLYSRFSSDLDSFVMNIEAFLVNSSSASISFEMLGKLEQYLLSESLNKKNSSQDRVIRKRARLTEDVEKATTSFASDKTLDFSNSKFSPAYISGAYFQNRSNQGQVVLALNSDIAKGAWKLEERNIHKSKCTITPVSSFDNISQRYRYMHTGWNERIVALDRHLHRLQKLLCITANIPEDCLQSFHEPSKSLSWFCGRICSDGDGKLNSSSIMLESSFSSSNGRRVFLDLSEVSKYSIFPGQIVLVEGVNLEGRKIVAKQLVDSCYRTTQSSVELPVPSSFHAVVASGPFTTSDNLDYAPLLELLHRILVKKPDVVILVGPFVDISHPQLCKGLAILGDEETGKHHASFEMVFVEKIIRDALRVFFNSEDEHQPTYTQIILVPSLLDGHHEFVFPQPPFADREPVLTDYFDEPLGVLNLPLSKDSQVQRIHLMSNPCIFKLNGISFGITSNDILFPLSQEEISAKMDDNRLHRLANHVLKQRSFAPQFPPSPSFPSQYDFRQSKHWEFNNPPDVLILPSKLSCLAKDIDGTVVLNPGVLSKGVGGGTFAEISVVLNNDSTTEAFDASKCKVEVVRI